jgi:hypothetical protein
MTSHAHECPICQKSILDAANLHYHMKFCRKKKFQNIIDAVVSFDLAIRRGEDGPYLLEDAAIIHMNTAKISNLLIQIQRRLEKYD